MKNDSLFHTSTFLILCLLLLVNLIWISCAVVVGLVVGIIIGRSTEYYTSQSYRPTQKLSESGKTGPATVIISGIGLGMLSTAIPVVAVVIGIIASYLLASAGDFGNVGMGLYGIGIAAVGMLSTLGFTLATDAYGPRPVWVLKLANVLMRSIHWVTQLPPREKVLQSVPLR